MSATAAELFDRRAHNPSFFEVSAAAPSNQPVLDFCVPVNLHYPKNALFAAIRDKLGDIIKYYPDYAGVHQAHVSRLIGIQSENIVVANGSTEIITELVRSADGPILTCAPTFGQWTDLPREHGKRVDFLLRRREDGFRLDPKRIVDHVRAIGARTLVLSNPNNPTGVGMPLAEIEQIVAALDDLSLIAIDESFIDFSALGSAGPLATRSTNVVVVKSMGKTLGWHGLRLGYAVSNAHSAELLRRQMPFWNINGLAAFVLAHVADRPALLSDSLNATALDRDAMADALAKVDGLKIYPSAANFIFAELAENISGSALRERLLSRHGVFIRDCGNKIGSSSRYLRLAVADRAAVERLVTALRHEL